ncbi:MAG TPA: DUF177 domain-containing protein [Caldimonas sp.]
MTSRAFEPTRLDVGAFAAAGAELEGRWPLRQFDRICESAVAELAPAEADAVVWKARGEKLPARDGEPESWLHVQADATVALRCQRCLAAVQIPLVVRRKFRFVHGEDAAAQLDAESADDVLAMTRALDLPELIEDELLLALPLVPMHAACPTPLPAPRNDEVVEERPHPFAALAGLKIRGRPG